MNTHQPKTTSSLLGLASIALLALCAAGCGGGDAIALASQTRVKDPPAILPVGIAPRAAMHEAAAASAAQARPHADRGLGMASAPAALTNEPADDGPTEAPTSAPRISTEAAAQAGPSAAQRKDPSDDGSEVTPIAVDEFGALQPEPATARR